MAPLNCILMLELRGKVHWFLIWLLTQFSWKFEGSKMKLSLLKSTRKECLLRITGSDKQNKKQTKNTWPRDCAKQESDYGFSDILSEFIISCKRL